MASKDKTMTLTGHLQELRVRLIWITIFFVISLVVGFILAQPLVEYFKNSPAAEGITWNVFALSDALRVYLQFAFIIALVFTLPVILYQLWRFVAPGLTEKERKLTLWFIPFSFLLFLVGISFSYFIIFPMIVSFLTSMATQLQVQEMYGISQYFGFMFNLILPFGLLFELPVIVVFLTRLGILKPQLLIRYRKIAYLILVIISASITPPELVSQILVAVPLIILYEFSIWLSKIAAMKRDKSLNSEVDDD